MSIARLMDITQASREQVIELLEGTENQRQELERENARMRALLTRYRNETPLGNQPHMIAHQVDAALANDKDES